MKRCPNPKCKAQNPDDFLFCEQCGENLIPLTGLEEEEVKKEIEASKMTNAYSLGVWGPRASGKTTYIVMTYGSCLKGLGSWRTAPNDIKTHKFISPLLSKLMRTGEFPPATDPTKKPEIYSFGFRPANRKKPDESTDKTKKTNEGGPMDLFRQILDVTDISFNEAVDTDPSLQISVTFSDVSGEQYFKAEYEDTVWESLATSRGIICLLDPGLPEEHFEMTDKMLNYLRLKGGHTVLPQRIAFCFSKIDQPQFYKYYGQPDKLIEELADNSGINLKELVETFTHSSKVKFFTLSSVGVDQQGQSLCDGGKLREPKKIRPLNIIEPLEWFFKEAKKEQMKVPSKRK